jgi:hypothetical protein
MPSKNAKTKRQSVLQNSPHKPRGRPHKQTPVLDGKQLHPQVRQLLDEIERFLDDHEMSRTMFGKLAANDGKLVPRLEQYSRATTLQTIDKVRDFMQDYASTRE